MLSVIFNGLAKAILFLLTIIIARSFGNNIKTDIYFFIYSTMILLSGFINAIDIAVLIPESMRIRQNESNTAAMGFLNYFFRLYLVIGIVFVTIMYFFGTIIFGFVSKFNKTDIDLYKNYFLLGSFYFLFQVITNYINNILTSLKFFTVPMIISGINSAIIITGILLLHYRFDVLSILMSGVAAYLINCIILIAILKKAANWNFLISAKPFSNTVPGNILYTELGQLATFASSYFPLYLLSGFNSGIISSMSYGKNIADIPNTLITAQLSNVSGIKLNEEIANQDPNAVNATFVRTAKLMVFLLVPISFFLFISADAVVAIFYGNKTLTSAINDTISFLQLLSVTGFCIAINSLVARLFIATQKIKAGLLYQLFMNAILLAITWLAVKIYGPLGYGYAIIIVNLINYLLLFFVCKKIFNAIDYMTVLKYTAKIVMVNGIIALVFYYALLHAHIDAYLLLAGISVSWTLILCLLNRFFHLNTDLSLIIKKYKD